MTTQHFFLWNWYWDPFALGICAAVLGGLWFRTKPKAGFFWLGMALLVAALLSPIATLARTYLFSAHMLQHLLLLLVVPPLLLLSLPLRESRGASHSGKLERTLTSTPATWMAGVGAMWLWHAPLLCNAATTSLWIYRLQIVSLLLLGALFWWPIAGPRVQRRLSPPAGIAYLVSACFACTLLGIYVTFAPVSVCSIYMHPVDHLGLLPLIRNGWGFTPQVDQQVGGLMMWVPACLIYLSGVMGLLARWYAGDETSLAPAHPVPNASS